MHEKMMLSTLKSVEQRTSNTESRSSTVATTTEIYDYLRLLFAKTGTPYCHNCGTKITKQTIEQILHRVSQIPKDTKIMILSPIIKGKKGEHKEILQKIRRKGFVRARVDGDIVDSGTDIKLSRYKTHDIDVVVDRLIIKSDIQKRLYDSIRTSLELGEGVVMVSRKKKGKWEDMVFSEHYSCPGCGNTSSFSYDFNYEELAPRMFSFNSPYGSCRECEGLGMTLEFDPELIIPNKELSLGEGAVHAWSNWSPINQDHYSHLIDEFSGKFDIDLKVPFKKFNKRVKNILLYGEGQNNNADHFEGIIPTLWSIYDKTNSPDVVKRLEGYMDYDVCDECSGARLRPEALSIKVNDKSIAEITSMTVEKAFDFFKSLKFQGEREILAGRILKEITTRLSFMIDIGLSYLTLDRRSNTLSGGEMQRIQLATKNKCLIRFSNYKWIEPHESSTIKKIDINHIYIPVKKEEL